MSSSTTPTIRPPSRIPTSSSHPHISSVASGPGYKRSPSVNAAVGFFEEKARSASASAGPSTPPRSQNGSRRPSISSSTMSRSNTSSPSRTTATSPVAPSRSAIPRPTRIPSGSKGVPPPRRRATEESRSGEMSRGTSAESSSNSHTAGPKMSRRAAGPAGGVYDEWGRRVSDSSAMAGPSRRPNPPLTSVSPPSKQTLARRQSEQSPRTTPRTNPTSRFPEASPSTPRNTTSPRIGSSPRFPSSPRTPQSTITPKTRKASTPNIAVSHPTPEQAPRLPPKDSIAQRLSPRIPSDHPGSRHTSNRVTHINDSSSSLDSKVAAEPRQASHSNSESIPPEAIELENGDSEPPVPRPMSGPPIHIPPRRSSAHSSIESSPTMGNGPRSPRIAQRSSSIEQRSPNPALEATRAANNVILGDVFEETDLSPSLPSVSPRPDRKSPGLSIDLPQLVAARSASNAYPARPSPPIPVKSPLRSLSRQSSSSHVQTLHTRSSSKESISATIGSLTSASTPVRPERRQSVMTVDESIELTPQTKDIPLFQTEELRFTTLTYASIYSQDSGPPSATIWPAEPVSAVEPGEKRVRRQSRMDDLWGKMRESDTQGAPEARGQLRLDMPEYTMPGIHTESPVTATTANTSAANSAISLNASIGHSIGPITPASEVPPRPVRSPSAPLLAAAADAPAKAAKLLGVNSAALRAGTDPTPLLPSALTRSPTAPVLSPRTPSTASKRTHLIREIAATERAYARDLALIKEAYLGRYLRPGSTTSNGEVGSSRRGSVTPMSEHKRMSGMDWLPPTTPISPLPRSPSYDLATTSSGYFTPSNTATTSATSLSNQGWIRDPSRTSVNTSMMPPPVGKPLSPQDVRAVFLNIDVLAAGAEELAAAFERAMGDETPGIAGIGREGESGSDRLGEVFTALMPKLDPIYHYYCARQQNASTRLLELLSDPVHSTHLHDCWNQIKDQTHAWNLDSMLIKPVQRITKYPLLFDDLLACTTPVHPDYFKIRSAADMARRIAVEIDEAKRRKDVVASAISRKPTILPSPSKDGKGKGLKLFRKEKNIPATLPSSTSTLSLANDTPPPEISKTSFLLLRDSVRRVEEAEQVVMRVGKEIIMWTAATKEFLVAQDGFVATWAKVFQLDMGDGLADRLDSFRAVVEKILGDYWATLNEEVRESILPVFSKLLDSSVNPRKVITKRESKYNDYMRYSTLVKSRKPSDRPLLLSARDFYALHCQLVDELPAFIEGYSRILDLALTAFARAQGRYHEGVKTALGEFASRWIARPRRSPKIPEEQHEELDMSTGRGIVKAWHNAWEPYSEAMNHFQSTKPARAMASRIASFNARPGSRPNSRPSSPANHQRTSSYQRESSYSSSSRPGSRTRSTSLLGAPPGVPLASPTKPELSRFNLLRVGSRTPKSVQSSPRNSRPTSLHVPQNENPNRYSFGLPKIPNGEKVFDGLGISPAKSPVAMTNSLSMPASSMRATSDPAAYDRAEDPGRAYPSRPPAPASPADNLSGLGLGNIERERNASGGTTRVVSDASVSVPPPSPRRPAHARKGSKYDVDASEGWRNEPILYQCACVAGFDPVMLGDRKYRGLKFLPMVQGDLFDVFHEVGRIDDLPSFPYPEIGVDNDGVLVGRGEDGSIGLLICSFLEPLRE